MKRLFSYFAALGCLANLFSQDEKLPELESFEITAYRFESDTLSTPVNSTVITREMISESGATALPEALQKLANIQFKSFSSSSEGNLAMRGFGENSEMRVLVLVDGQRYNRPDMAPISWTHIPLSNVESVEVLRGSQSAMYGNSAIAGVVKITTKKPEKNEIGVNAVYGSYGFYMANGYANARINDFFFGIDASRINDDGYRDNSRTWTNVVGATVGYDFDQNNSVKFSGNYSESYTELPNSLDWDTFQNNPRTGNLNWINRSTSGAYSALFENESSFGRGAVNFGLNFRDRQAQQYTPLGTPLNSTMYNDQWLFSLNPRYEINGYEDWKIFFGIDADYATINFDNIGTFGSKGRLPTTYADIGKLDLGAYSGFEYWLNEDLSFVVSGRAEASRIDAKSTSYYAYSLDPSFPFPPIVDPSKSYSENTWMGGLAASLGVNYKLTEVSSIYARFDQVYRYPVTDELAYYQGITGGGGLNFNKNLNPETGQNYEIGYKYADKNWRANVNLFALYMHNEIMYNPVSMLNENMDPTFRYGLDMNVSYDDKFWGAYAALSLVKSEFWQGDYEGKTIPLVPFLNSTGGIYVKPLENLTLLARVTFYSDQIQGNDFDNNLRRMPWYILFDIQANYRFCDYASAYVAVENIGDEYYAAFAYNDGFYPARGRSFKVGVNIKF